MFCDDVEADWKQVEEELNTGGKVWPNSGSIASYQSPSQSPVLHPGDRAMQGNEGSRLFWLDDIRVSAECSCYQQCEYTLVSDGS
jgi:hypothetical protein